MTGPEKKDDRKPFPPVFEDEAVDIDATFSFSSRRYLTEKVEEDYDAQVFSDEPPAFSDPIDSILDVKAPKKP